MPELTRVNWIFLHSTLIYSTMSGVVCLFNFYKGDKRLAINSWHSENKPAGILRTQSLIHLWTISKPFVPQPPQAPGCHIGIINPPKEKKNSENHCSTGILAGGQDEGTIQDIPAEISKSPSIFFFLFIVKCCFVSTAGFFIVRVMRTRGRWKQSPSLLKDNSRSANCTLKERLASPRFSV